MFSFVCFTILRNVPANFSECSGKLFPRLLLYHWRWKAVVESCWKQTTGNINFYGSFYWLHYDFVSWIINWRPHINLDIKIAGTVAIARPVSYKASDLHMIKWKILLNLARQLALEKIPPAKDPKRTFFKRCSDILHVTFCNIAQQI